MGVSWARSAVFVALLAYNFNCLRDMARSSAQAFLAPAGFGAEPEARAPLSAAALAVHTRLHFVADMHASPLMSARSVLVRHGCAPPACCVFQPRSRARAAHPRAGSCQAAMQLAQVQPQPRGASLRQAQHRRRMRPHLRHL